MTIDNYNEYLVVLLASHKNPPYERLNEGKVYVGPPNASQLTFRSTKDKSTFAYLFSMLVAFDLKVFEIDKTFYLALKNEFYIPKFEYGLTNTFVYPNRIFDDFKVGINEEFFEESFHVFNKLIAGLAIGSNLSIDNILYSISEDSDLNSGIFGSTFKRFIQNKLPTTK